MSVKKPICKNKLCKLFDGAYKRNCSVWVMNLGDAFITWCPMRKVFHRVSLRISHDKYIRSEKGRKIWNAYQKNRNKI